MIKSKKSPVLADDWAVSRFKIKYCIKANPKVVRDSDDAARILHKMWDKDLMNVQEQIGALYLDSRSQCLGFRLISTGKLNLTNLDTPLLLSCGLLSRAHSVIIAHNHPAGDPTPSRADIRTTLQVMKSMELVGLKLYDHIILSQDTWHSMADARNFIPYWKRKEDGRR